ncbi:hypothetical protein EXIGLDRAFT_759035 [Exidia glandulosa HHB12029]|uniref:Uncharacterized protein n=1 Tax=Exidia glandulosa HHB12029 TaxID=1314781 RepID=A0A165Q6D8_EXIGL|nr:hypothetical protein EXIGLDRAFT_759035 [Exidia glandulosa HHB12029]
MSYRFRPVRVSPPMEKLPPGTSFSERVHVVQRRIQKAERDERVEIARCLTPAKTYLGGFTQPKELMLSKFWPGGVATKHRKHYEPPLESAYFPHTVLLLQSSASLLGERGRTPSPDFRISSCNANVALSVLARINSLKDNQTRSTMRAMLLNQISSAYARTGQSVRWWKHGEDPASIRRTALAGDPMPTVSEIDEADHPLRVEASNRNSRQDTTAASSPSSIASTSHLPSTRNDAEPASTKHDREAARELARILAQSQSSTSAMLNHLLPSRDEWEAEEEDIRRGVRLTENDIIELKKSAGMSPDDHPLTEASRDNVDVDEPDPDDPNAAAVDRLEPSPSKRQLNDKLGAMLEHSPCYRPVLAVTFPSRPIAMTVARLATANITNAGLEAYFAAIETFGRKSKTSFPLRMSSLHIQRMLNLSLETAKRLHGYHGGLIGARMRATDRGWGSMQDRAQLADPRPPEAQRVVVRVGTWHPRADEIAEWMRIEAARWELEHVEVRFVDARGYELDEHKQRLPGQLSREQLLQEQRSGQDEEQDEIRAEEDVDEEDEDQEQKDEDAQVNEVEVEVEDEDHADSEALGGRVKIARPAIEPSFTAPHVLPPHLDLEKGADEEVRRIMAANGFDIAADPQKTFRGSTKAVLKAIAKHLTTEELRRAAARVVAQVPRTRHWQ